MKFSSIRIRKVRTLLLDVSTLDPSDYMLGLIPCRYEVSMRGTVRMLPPGLIRPFSLLQSTRTRVIEPFGRGCGFSATRNETLHSSYDNSGYRISNHRSISPGKERCTPGKVEEKGSKIGPLHFIKVPDMTF